MPEVEMLKAILTNGGAFALLAFIVVAYLWRALPAMSSDFRAALAEQRADFRAELAAERESREHWAAQVDAALARQGEAIDRLTMKVG